MTHPYKDMVEKQLTNLGGLYSFEDLVEMIRTGEMQSFCNGDSWVVTQVNTYPRKTVVHIVMAVGVMEELLEIEKEVCSWAKSDEVGATAIVASGRLGWDRMYRNQDRWEHLSNVYMRGI